MVRVGVEQARPSRNPAGRSGSVSIRSAAIGASLRFAVVAALIATTIGVPRRDRDQCVAATRQTARRRLDAAARHFGRHHRSRHAHHLRHAAGRLAGAWWLVPLGHALVAVPFVVRACSPCCGRSPPICALPRRRWARHRSGPGGRSTPAPAPAAAGRRRVLCGDLARRVRGHHDPESRLAARRCRLRSAACSGAPGRCRGLRRSQWRRSVGVDDGDRDGLR